MLALRQLGEYVGGLVHPAALLARFRPDLASCLPEAEPAVGDRQLGPHIQAAPLQVEQQMTPIVGTFPGTVGEADQLLLALRRGPDQHENALLFILQARFQVDAIGPDVDVALRRQITLLPLRMLVLPNLLEPANRRRR